MTLKDSADEMTFDLLEVPIVDKDIEGAVDNVTLDGNQYTDYLWLKKQFIQKWSILCDDEYTRLRGFYTRQFENADVPSYRLYYGDDIIRNSTLSGERIELSISGVADGTMSLTQMDGNIEQDGTPTPSAPVPVQTVTGRQTIKAMGKNLIEPIMPSWTYHGVLCTNNGDGSFTLNGTATATATWRISQSSANGHDNMLNLNGTYTLSCSGLQNGMRLVVTQLNVWQTVGAMNGNENPATFTTNLDDLIVYVAVTNGTTVNNVTIRPMLEVGNQASAYEPYKGQNYEINLGKNLFDKDNANILQAGITTTKIESATANRTLWIPCEPNTTYTVQKRNDGDTNRFNVATTAITPAIDVAITNRVENPNASSITYTTSSTAKYLCVQYFRTAETILTEQQVLDSIQIEKGYIASSYSAYFTPIELCKIGTYQDRIYKSDGKWWLEKQTGKVVLNGSEDWHKSSNTQVDRYWYNIYSGEVTPSFHQIYSDKFFYEYNVPTVNAMWVDVYQTLERLFVNFASYGTTTVTNFKTWLASNPTTVYYPLATPTTTEITDEALVEELEALQDEAISVGQHNIYTDTPNALPTLTFDLTEYLSQSTTIIPETAVRLTLTDGGVINACGCRKDVQLTMRETIE